MAVATAVMIFLAAFASALSAYAIARVVVAKSLLPDRPNGRSAHRRVTPRAGGFAIIGGFLLGTLGYAVFLTLNDAAPIEYAPLVAGGLAAFLFGAIDDARPIGARVKLAAQTLIAIAFVALIGPVASIPLPVLGDTPLGHAAFPLTVFWIVAFMNAFNFMDGVNGIAGACAVFVLAALGVAAAGGGALSLAPAAIFLSCALFGFLPLNFPSGRLFMGDGGSQAVGFLIAAFAVLTSKGDDGAIVSAMFTPLAFMPFLFDVAFTLVHRLHRKRNVFEAHNEHLYQLMVRLGRSHQSVTTTYLSVTALSTSVAIIANSIAPGLQFLAVFALLAVFLPAGLAIYRRAARKGLLGAAASSATEKLPAERAQAFPAAAE